MDYFYTYFISFRITLDASYIIVCSSNLSNVTLLILIFRIIIFKAYPVIASLDKNSILFQIETHLHNIIKINKTVMLTLTQPEKPDKCFFYYCWCWCWLLKHSGEYLEFYGTENNCTHTQLYELGRLYENNIRLSFFVRVEKTNNC